MFKFNFASVEPAEGGPAHTATERAAVPASEVQPQQDSHAVDGWDSITIAGLTLLKARLRADRQSALIPGANTSVSDLVPGKYEGGLKLWEGGVDLAELVAEQYVQSQPRPAGANEVLAQRPALQGQRVLELGCGHGLPGIVALAAGAEVHFQDFNAEVLETLTVPNASANWDAWRQQSSPDGSSSGTTVAAAAPPARFFAGSWAALSDLLRELGLAGAYDLILTAETIYSTEGARELYGCIKQALRWPDGCVLLSAKSHYFGVGGGTALFRQMVMADCEMRVQRLRVLGEDGRSNRRELLRLTWAEAAST